MKAWELNNNSWTLLVASGLCCQDILVPPYEHWGIRTYCLHLQSLSELVLESGTLYNGRVKETCRVESSMGKKRRGFGKPVDPINGKYSMTYNEVMKLYVIMREKTTHIAVQVQNLEWDRQTHTQIHTYKHKHTHTNTYMYKHTHKYKHTHTQTKTNTHTNTNAHRNTHTHTTQTHTHKHIDKQHTHTKTQTHRQSTNTQTHTNIYKHTHKHPTHTHKISLLFP